MGRVFARKFGVCGKALPDYELSWLQIWQHELATREADAIKARRVSRRLRSVRDPAGQTLIRMSNKGFGLAPPGRPAPQGGRSWTGAPDAQTRHDRKSTVSTLYIRGSAHRGK
jgi:hypothetical protein